MKEVFDIIRSRWVVATPEEVVRQQWIHQMVQNLGFPKEYISVEKEVDGAQRRADILVYSRDCTPLLLIECKAKNPTHADLNQVLGYNSFIKAPYVALVSDRHILFRYSLACDRCEIDRLPTYQELCDGLR